MQKKTQFELGYQCGAERMTVVEIVFLWLDVGYAGCTDEHPFLYLRLRLRLRLGLRSFYVSMCE